MLIGVPKEMHHDDHRVTASPQTAERLLKLGHTVLAEASTGGMACSRLGDKVSATAWRCGTLRACSQPMCRMPP